MPSIATVVSPETTVLSDSGLVGQSLRFNWPVLQMMSSFLRAWVWQGVVCPAQAYISFSQYSGSVARLMRVRPQLEKSPKPKSVISHLGFGGSAQQDLLKHLEAWRKALLI